MKRIWIVFAVVLSLAFGMASVALASEANDPVNDMAGLLSDAQRKGLNDRALAIADKYG